MAANGKRIWVLVGHPAPASFCEALAEAYAAAATGAGAEVRVTRISSMRFDPILHSAYQSEQALEPDLVEAQAILKWCQHWVVVYPVWWGSVPAALKGFLDRALLPGFAFRPHDEDALWDKLLSGRSGRLVTTADAPWWWLRFAYHASDVRMMKHAVMEFCGIKPVAVTRAAGLARSAASVRAAYLDKVRRDAVRDAG